MLALIFGARGWNNALLRLFSRFHFLSAKIQIGPIRKVKVKKAQKWARVKNRLMSSSLVKLCYVFWANSSTFSLLYWSIGYFLPLPVWRLRICLTKRISFQAKLSRQQNSIDQLDTLLDYLFESITCQVLNLIHQFSAFFSWLFTILRICSSFFSTA